MKRLLPLLIAAALLPVAVSWATSRASDTPARIPTAPEKSVRVIYPERAQPDMRLPDGRHERIRSLLNVERRMHYGEFIWNDDGVPAGPSWIRVDLAAQTVSIFRAGHEIGTAVILYGTDGYATPTGAFRVLEKDKDHWSRSYDAAMPYMLRLTDDGVAIHASDVKEGFATHGCIGVPLAFARRLFEAMKQGDSVVILAGKNGAIPAVQPKSS
jgi:lipoprotein-anchoring transpeptidase ErfK/SrfK